MRVITFYSYKGGVGRTLACANYGLYLAKTGQKVVLVDMDFESPGLDSKFFSDGTTSISNGLLDQITAFQQGKSLPYLSPISIPLPEEVASSGGRLQLIPAGDYFAPDEYHKALSKLDWEFLLQSEQGLAFWFDLMSRIENQLQPDVLVIDSRTGITEIGGLCTQVLPDTVLLFTSTSPESMDGTRRMYERIQKKSRLIGKQQEGRSNVELFVVLTRVPRMDDVKAFDRRMKQRLNMEVPRLYYVFADSDLATSEYLAMNRFGGKAPEILADYIELFASLNPEDAHGYIESRLASFREELLRAGTGNRRVIQELLTLFPRSEVYLAAARYFRLVKETEDSIVNYMNYLQNAPEDREVILEFADVCTAAPQAALIEYREIVVRHLATLGPNAMTPQTLSLFCALARSPEQFQSIVTSIEGDPSRLSSPQLRSIYFRALSELQQWEKLVASATDTDLKDVAVQRILAKAYAKLRTPDKALQIIQRLPLQDPTEVLPIIEILYDLRTDANKNDIRKAIQENRSLSSYLRHYSTTFLEHPNFPDREGGEFRSWVRDLLSEKKLSQ